MGRGPKKALKRIVAPKSWMLDKLGGTFATKPSQGPHRERESIPLTVVLKNRLRYALTGREVMMIVNDKEGNIAVDGKIRRDPRFPAGLMDVVSIRKTGELYRLLYDVKGRFVLRNISEEEAKIKLCKITKKAVGPNKIPYLVTHDGRTLRFPNPEISVYDSVKLDIATGKVLDHCKFETGNSCIITSGNNVGRVGTIVHRDRHIGGFDIVHVRDARGHSFATRIGNVFMIGKGKNPWITLPKEKGISLTPLEEKHSRAERGKKKKTA
jgi:small subunit ribosomal protein S4e